MPPQVKWRRTHRVGRWKKDAPEPRPLLVEFCSQYDRDILLSRLALVYSGLDADIRITPDLPIPKPSRNCPHKTVAFGSSTVNKDARNFSLKQPKMPIDALLKTSTRVEACSSQNVEISFPLKGKTAKRTKKKKVRRRSMKAATPTLVLSTCLTCLLRQEIRVNQQSSLPLLQPRQQV